MKGLCCHCELIGGPWLSQVTVDDWPGPFRAMRFDSMIANADVQGSGFVIRQNTIINNRGRGVLIKASNGIIERNAILGPAWWGMQVGALCLRCSQPSRSTPPVEMTAFGSLAGFLAGESNGCQRHWSLLSLHKVLFELHHPLLRYLLASGRGGD